MTKILVMVFILSSVLLAQDTPDVADDPVISVESPFDQAANSLEDTASALRLIPARLDEIERTQGEQSARFMKWRAFADKRSGQMQGMLDLMVEQDEKIKELEARIAALEPAPAP